MHLQVKHGRSDNVPGNSYVVKGSGFATSGHAKDLRVIPGLAPEPEQHKVSFTECEVLRARAAIIEDIFVQERVELVKGDVEIASGLGFCIELFDWFKRSRHNFLNPYPFRRMRGSRIVVPFPALLRYQVNCPKTGNMKP